MGWHPFPGNYPDPDPAQKISVGEQIPIKPKSGSKTPFIKGGTRSGRLQVQGNPPPPIGGGTSKHNTHPILPKVG
jgi:hypothetical protein